MSDFIFSIKNIEQNKITTAIQSIYKQAFSSVSVTEFHGEWGSLGVSKNLYNGFEPYENEQFIVVVVGGPILMFRDNRFINNKNNNEGTKAIFERWISGKMRWDNDLSGPFVVLIVDKQHRKAICVTDLMSFIPVYSYANKENIVISTHVDTLASTTQQTSNVDKVSVVDFVLHGFVTYPYTIYENLFQIPPASEHTIVKETTNLKSVYYWLPKELNKYNSIKHAAVDLRNSLHNYIDKITTETSNIAQFVSGGEDSRTLSGLLKDFPRDAYIFLDHMNREGKIAKEVADRYGATFKLATRNKLHYLNILPSCSDLVGSGSQYHHAHTYGFHNTCQLNSYVAVFGGLLADALLKGSHIKKVSGYGRFRFLPDVKNFSYSAGSQLKSSLFSSDVLLKLTKRRQNHLQYVKSFRNESAEEWFELWPSSMNRNIPNIHANRRLFRSYEPFTSKDIVKLSATVPQKWKLNRRLFHRAAKPFLKSSKWLLHGDGWLPYFPWYMNTFVHFTTWFYRSASKRLGLNKGHHGPWGEWDVVVNSAEWKKTFNNYYERIDQISDIFQKKPHEKLLRSSLSRDQFVNLTQVLYQIKDKK